VSTNWKFHPQQLPGTDLIIVVPESNPVHDTHDVSVRVSGTPELI
jgi:hypothetical protein